MSSSMRRADELGSTALELNTPLEPQLCHEYDPTIPPVYDPDAYDPEKCGIQCPPRSPVLSAPPSPPATSSPALPQPAMTSGMDQHMAQMHGAYDQRRLLPAGSPEPTMGPEADSSLRLLVPKILAGLRRAAIHIPDLPLTKDGWPESPDWSPISERPDPVELSACPVTTSAPSPILEHAPAADNSSLPAAATNNENGPHLDVGSHTDQQANLAYQDQRINVPTSIPTPPKTDASLDDVKEITTASVANQEQQAPGVEPTPAATAVDAPSAPAPASASIAPTVPVSLSPTPTASSGKRKATRAPRASKPAKRTKVEAVPSPKGPPTGVKITPIPVPHVPHTPQPELVSTPPPTKRKAPAKKRAPAAKAIKPVVVEDNSLQQSKADTVPVAANTPPSASKLPAVSGPDGGSQVDDMVSAKEVASLLLDGVVNGNVEHEPNSGRPSRIKKRKAPFEQQATVKPPAKKAATKNSKAGQDSAPANLPSKSKKAATEPKKTPKPKAPRATKPKAKAPTLPLPASSPNAGGLPPVDGPSSTGATFTPALAAIAAGTGTLPVGAAVGYPATSPGSFVEITAPPDHVAQQPNFSQNGSPPSLPVLAPNSNALPPRIPFVAPNSGNTVALPPPTTPYAVCSTSSGSTESWRENVQHCTCPANVSTQILSAIDNAKWHLPQHLVEEYERALPLLCSLHRDKLECLRAAEASTFNPPRQARQAGMQPLAATVGHHSPPLTNVSLPANHPVSYNGYSMSQMGTPLQSTTMMNSDLPSVGLMGHHVARQSQSARWSTDIPEWSQQPSPPGGFKPQQKSAPMPPPAKKPRAKPTKAAGVGMSMKAAPKMSKAKLAAQAKAEAEAQDKAAADTHNRPAVNGEPHPDAVAAASIMTELSLQGRAAQPHLPNGSGPKVAPLHAQAPVPALATGSLPPLANFSTVAKPAKAPPKPRKKAVKPGPKPTLNLERDAKYKFDLLAEIGQRRSTCEGELKTHGAVTDSVIYRLLQEAHHPNTDPAMGRVEVHVMSGSEAHAAMESGWPDMPIVTEKQQFFQWADTNRPIEEIFRRMENLDRSVSVQIPSRDCRDDSFESRDLVAVRERFLARRETNEPWNILDLRSPVPAAILPGFLTGENCQLLLRLRDSVLMPERAERSSATPEQWNEWRDVLEWVLLSEGGHNTSPHTDSHGLATWITVQEGQFGFGYLSHPTEQEREAWMMDPHNFVGGRWRYVILDPGQTVFFNSGTIHFVFRLKSEQTLALGGHILQWSGIKQWIDIVSAQMNNPHITNEDMEWSAPKYVRMVGELVEKRLKDGRVHELGGVEKVQELLKLILDFDEKYVKPKQKKAKSKSKGKGRRR